MRNSFLFYLLILSILTLYSCSKNNSENNGLAGDWNIVNDSSLNTNQFFALPLGDSGVISSNYNGKQCGATFNFDSNGILRTSFYNCMYGMGPTVDSAKYVVTNNQVAISIYARKFNCCSFVYLNPVIKRTYKITNLTANTATLTYSQVSNSLLPEQSIPTEIINLKR